MTKSTGWKEQKRRQKVEIRRWYYKALRAHGEGSGRPFECVPNWIVTLFTLDANDLDLRRRLNLPKTGQNVWRGFQREARRENDLRIESLASQHRYCILPGVQKRGATGEERDAIEVTREWLLEHCRVDEASGCWIWQGHLDDGQPQANITVGPAISATMLVRRLAFKVRYKGKRPPIAGYKDINSFLAIRLVGARAWCEDACCCPEHMVARTKVEAMAPRKGKPISYTHRVNIAKARRARSKLSDAVVAQVIASDVPAKHESIRLGMHESYVSKLRRGACRAITPNPFLQLLTPLHGSFEQENKQ